MAPAKTHILIADQASGYGPLLAEHFQVFGFDTRLCLSGPEAEKALKQNTSVDLFFCAPSLKNSASQPLIESCKQYHPQKPHTFVLSQPSHTESEYYLDIGAMGFIYPPFDSQKLLSLARKALLPLPQKWAHPPAQEVKFCFKHDTSSSPPRLGQGGVSLATHKLLPDKDQLIAIDLQLDNININCIGQLCWKRKLSPDSITAIGLEFIYIDNPTIDFVLQAIQQLESPAYIPKWDT